MFENSAGKKSIWIKISNKIKSDPPLCEIIGSADDTYPLRDTFSVYIVSLPLSSFAETSGN